MLYKHQITGVEFLKEKKNVILADEMGLGKTRQSIVAMSELTSKPILVVCPASLKLNWKKEINYDTKQDIFIARTGSDYIERKRWIIVNYDILAKLKDQLLDMDLEGMILDEAHYIKGKIAKGRPIRAAVSLELAEKMKYVFALTGTPIMNRPAEMFNLLNAIKHPLGRSRVSFTKRYCGAYLNVIMRKGRAPIRFMDESGATNTEELHVLTKGSILRRLKKDVLDLPEKIISIRDVELKKDWQKRYDQAFDDYLLWAADQKEKNLENIIDAQHLIELQKLKQISSLSKVDQIAEDTANANEQGEKVIIFSQYKQTIKNLHAKLKNSVTLTGSSTMNQRQEVVDRFQNDPNIKVFIGNIKAAGVGITLTEASIVIFADMEWSPALHAQAEDRAHRMGQTGTVNVYYYVALDTIDEDIVSLLEEKRKIIEDVIDEDELKKIVAIKDDQERYEALDKFTNRNTLAQEFTKIVAKKVIHNSI